MNDKNGQKMTIKKRVAYSAKECAYLAVFVALVIAAQLAFAMVPGVEVVTVLFVTYAFVFGSKRGLAAATAFTVLRQIVFGVEPKILILYLVYFNALAMCFGTLGQKRNGKRRNLFLVVGVACVGTVCFSILDNILTVLWYGYSKRAAQAYVLASLSFMIPQTVCTAVTVFFLFEPLRKAFEFIKTGLKRW